MLPAEVPNVTPLALLKPTVAKVNEPLLAEAATGCVDWALEAEAVIVAPLKPKLTLFELENITEARLLEVVPALKLTGDGAPAGAAAVITEPFKPKVIPPALSNVIAERLLLVVPAETRMFVRLVATLAVIVEPFSPKLTLLPSEKERLETRLFVVPALNRKLPCVEATVTLATMPLPAVVDQLTLLELLKIIVEKLKLPLGAEAFTG